jgi:hypothetical protein
MKLLIFIPTYNRPNNVQILLNTLFDEILSIPDIKVVVSDNDSQKTIDYDSLNSNVTDALKTGQLAINKNNFNIGMSNNILLGFVHSINYEWLWILSDDDQLIPGFKDKILNTISNSTENVVAVKYGSKKNNQYDLLTQDIIVEDCLSPVIFNSYIFLSNTIYKISNIKNYMFVGFENAHTYVPHFLILIAALNENKKVVKIEESKLVNYIVPKIGYSYWKVAGLGVGGIKFFNFFMEKTNKKNFYKIFFPHNDFKVFFEMAFLFLYKKSDSVAYNYYSSYYINSLKFARSRIAMLTLVLFSNFIKIRFFFHLLIYFLERNEKYSPHVIEIKKKYE